MPDIINKCLFFFSIKASSIHLNTLQHFHLNRYTLVSFYICRILQAQRGRWHPTRRGQKTSSDFFFPRAFVCCRPESCFHGNTWLFRQMSVLKNSPGQHIRICSIWHEFHIHICLFFFFLFCFYIQFIRSKHFVRSLPQYGSLILLFQSHINAESALNWFCVLSTSTIYIYMYVYIYLYVFVFKDSCDLYRINLNVFKEKWQQKVGGNEKSCKKVQIAKK